MHSAAGILDCWNSSLKQTRMLRWTRKVVPPPTFNTASQNLPNALCWFREDRTRCAWLFSAAGIPLVSLLLQLRGRQQHYICMYVMFIFVMYLTNMTHYITCKIVFFLAFSLKRKQLK